MTEFYPNLITLLITIIIFTAIGGIIMMYLGYHQNLAEWRKTIRPGDLVRVKFQGETIRARVIRRNSGISFFCIDIDDKKQFTTSVYQIFEP